MCITITLQAMLKAAGKRLRALKSGEWCRFVVASAVHPNSKDLAASFHLPGSRPSHLPYPAIFRSPKGILTVHLSTCHLEDEIRQWAAYFLQQIPALKLSPSVPLSNGDRVRL